MGMAEKSVRINVGCGMTPTPGWMNFDNSPSVKLARRPVRLALLKALGLLDKHHLEFVAFCREHDVLFAAGQRLPLPDKSVEVAYTCHTLEHMDRTAAREFLTEVKRVLRPGGVLRIAVPDLRYYCEKYVRDGDLESFMHYLHLTKAAPRGLLQKLKYLWVGDRHHQWMYDGPHLCRVLIELGFADPVVLRPGETTIPEPGPLNLSERAPESLYVETRSP